MLDQHVHVWLTNGNKWVVKIENDQFFYKAEDDGEEWTLGMPPGSYEGDLFGENVLHTRYKEKEKPSRGQSRPSVKSSLAPFDKREKGKNQ